MSVDSTLVPCIHRWKTLYSRLIATVGHSYGLTQTECDTILFLTNHPLCNTATEISTQRMIQKSNVSNAIESLKKKGFLHVKQDEQNRRILRLSLTPAVHDIAIELRATQISFCDLMNEGITAEEHATLTQLFKKLNKNASKALAQLEKETKQ